MSTTGMNDPNKCEWCGHYHQGKCPLVKSVEYEGGVIKRIEFFSGNELPIWTLERELKRP